MNEWTEEWMKERLLHKVSHRAHSVVLDFEILPWWWGRGGRWQSKWASSVRVCPGESHPPQALGRDGEAPSCWASGEEAPQGKAGPAPPRRGSLGSHPLRPRRGRPASGTPPGGGSLCPVRAPRESWGSPPAGARGQEWGWEKGAPGNDGGQTVGTGARSWKPCWRVTAPHGAPRESGRRPLSRAVAFLGTLLTARSPDSWGLFLKQLFKKLNSLKEQSFERKYQCSYRYLKVWCGKVGLLIIHLITSPQEQKMPITLNVGCTFKVLSRFNIICDISIVEIE